MKIVPNDIIALYIMDAIKISIMDAIKISIMDAVSPLPKLHVFSTVFRWAYGSVT